MKKVNDNFIMVYNRCFVNGVDKLSPLELFTCSQLYRCRLEYESGWITSTNILLLKSMLKCKIDGSRSEKLDTIKNVLLSLQQKGYIYSNVNVNTKHEDLLTVIFPTVDEKEESFRGFLKLTYNTFDLFDNRENLYIYTYLESNYNHEHKRHYRNKISLADWTTLLNIRSKSTVQSRIDNMNTSAANPRIYKFSGNYDGTERQDENTYLTRPNEKELLKWNNFYDENGKAKYAHKKKYSSEDIIYSPFEGEITINEFEELMDMSAWGKEKEDFRNVGGKYETITMEDYFIYLTCKQYNIYPKFNKKCEYIIKAKKDSFNYDHSFEEWEQDFASEDVTDIVAEYQKAQREAAKERYSVHKEQDDSDMPF